MGQQQWECRLECRDAMGRPATVLVTVRDGQLAIVAPAGEAAVFGLEQITQAEQLSKVLDRGISELRFRRGKSRAAPWFGPGAGRS